MGHHVDLCNKQLNTWMGEEVKRQKEVEGRVKIGKFVKEAVVRRLSMNGDYVRADRWAEALALTAIPPHCETTLKVPQSIALHNMLMNIYFRAFRLFVMTSGTI